MLDHFLKVAYESDKKHNEQVKLAHALKALPDEDLMKLAHGANLAFGDCEDWLEKYQGTPLYDQALALEKSELENEVARAQAEASQPDTSSFWKIQNNIRLQKKMLDLELMQQHQSPTMGGQMPMSVTSDPAQGAGAMGDSGPTAGAGEEPSKTAAVKEALSTDAIEKAVVNTVAKGGVSPERAKHLADLGGRVMKRGTKMIGDFGSGKTQASLGAGGSLIRQGATLQGLGAKMAMAKEALTMGELGQAALKAVKKNPSLVGAGVGALGGAVAGGEDHRLSGALAGAGLGAAAGHAGGGIAKRMDKGLAFGDAVKGYGRSLGHKVGIKTAPTAGSSVGKAQAAAKAEAAAAKAAPAAAAPVAEAAHALPPPKSLGAPPPSHDEVQAALARMNQNGGAPASMAAPSAAAPSMAPMSAAPATIPEEMPPMTLRSPNTLKMGSAMRFAHAVMELEKEALSLGKIESMATRGAAQRIQKGVAGFKDTFNKGTQILNNRPSAAGAGGVINSATEALNRKKGVLGQSLQTVGDAHEWNLPSLATTGKKW